MSDEDTRIVNMRINNKDFLKGTSDSLSALQKLNKGIDSAGKGKGMQELGGSVDKVKHSFGALQVAGVTALATITNKAVNAGLNLLKSFTIAPIMDGFREYNKLLTSTQTIMANTGQNASTVGKYLDDLNKYSDQTIYNFGQMADSIGKFSSAMGQSKSTLANATKAIKGLANTAALSGSSTEQLNTAMYQMSQAMAQGTIKLMDWNSLANAGMGGENIRNALMETARSFGDHGKAMDAAIKKHGSFRDSLRDGWLSAEVFTKTMRIMAGQTLGVSTSIKDLTNLGISKANQRLIKLGGTAKFSAKEMAFLAKKGFSQTQIDALEAGKSVAYTEKQLQKLGYSKEAAKNLARLSQEAIKSATTVKTFSQLIDVTKESIGSGWAGIFRQIFGNLTEASEMWTKVNDVIGNAVDGIFGSITNMLIVWHNMKDTESGLNGYQMAWQGIGNVFKAIGNILKPFIVLISSIFPSTQSGGEGLFDLTKGFYNFSIALEKATSNMEYLNPLMQGIGWAISTAFGSFFEMLKILAPIAVALGELGKAIGGLVERLFEMAGINVDIAGLFKGVLDVRNQILKPFVETIVAVINALTDLANGDIDFGQFKAKFVGAFSGLGSNIIDGIKQGLSPEGVLTKIGELATRMIDFFKNLLGIHSPSTVFEEFGRNIVEGIIKGIGAAIGALLGLIKGAVSAIADEFGGIDKFDLASIFSVIFTGTMFLAIRKFLNGLGEIMTNFKGFSKTVTGVFEQTTKTLKTMQTGIRARAILDIALAVGALAGSLWVLSKIPADKLGIGLGAITAMIGLLTGSMLLLQKGVGKKGSLTITAQLTAMAASMTAMAGALVILSAAVYAFGNMPTDVLLKGMAAIAVALAAMVAAGLLLGKAGPFLILGAGALTLLAVALGLLAPVLLLYSKMAWDDIKDGLAKLAVVLLSLGVAMIPLAALGPLLIFAAPALLILSAAMTTLLGAILLFAKADGGAIASGVSKIALALLAIGLASAVAAPGLILLGGAIVLIGAGMLALGAGLALAGAGLAAIAASGVVAFAALGAGVSAFLAMAPVMAVQFAAALKALATALADVAPEVADAFVKIAFEVIEAIVKIRVKIIEAVLDWIIGIIEALADAAPRLADAMTDLVTNMFDAIGDNAGELTTSAGQMILDFLQAIDDAIQQYLIPIQQEGMQIAFHLLEGLVLGLVPEPIRQAFSDLVDNIVNWFKSLLGINSPSTVFQGFGGDIVNGLINGITGLIGSAASAAGRLASNVVSAVVDFIKGLPGKAKVALSTLGGILKTVFTGAFNKAKDAVTNGVGAIKSGIGKIPGILRGMLGGIGSAARAVGSAIVNGIKDGLSKIGGALGGLGASVLKAVKGAINTILPIRIPAFKIPIPGLPDWKFGGKTIIPELAKGTDYFGGGMALVGEVGPELVSMRRGSSVITNKNLVGFMKAVNQLARSLTRGGSVPNGAGHISYTVDASFRGDPKTNGIAFAANIAAGLINGLRENQEPVNAAMANMGTAAAQAFAGVMGIQSPSTVFKKYGGYLGQGLIKGLMGSITTVQNAAKNLAEGVVDQFSKTISDAQLKLELIRAKADAYSEAAALARQKAKNDKLKKAEKKHLEDMAKLYDKQAKAAAAAAEKQQAIVDKQNKDIEDKRAFDQADSLGKAAILRDRAALAASNAADRRQKAEQYKLEANLVRKIDKKRAAYLDKKAQDYLTYANNWAITMANNLAKADEYAQSVVSTVSPESVTNAQQMFDAYARSLADAAAAAEAEQRQPIQLVQNNTSPEALSASEIYRNTKNLLSTTQRKLVGAGTPN